jgi:hypothetical protein
MDARTAAPFAPPPPADLPPLDSCGFVAVPADATLWMKCDSCGKSDHFWLTADTIRCRCGAIYGHALRPDGTQVPAAQLRFVPFAEGPRHLADLEWDGRRIAGLVLVLLVLVAAGIWAWQAAS